MPPKQKPKEDPITPDSQLLMTLRPLPTPTNHKTAIRIHLHREVVRGFQLKPGEFVQVYTAADADAAIPEEKRRKVPLVAWLTSDPAVTTRICQISEAARMVLGAGFENKVVVERYEGDGARNCNFVEVEEEVGLGKREALSEGWKWYLEHCLVEAKFLFPGLVMRDVEFKGEKRNFRIKRVDRSRAMRMYLASEHTSVQLAGMKAPEPQVAPAPSSSRAKEKAKEKEKEEAKDATPPPPPPVPGSTVTFSQIGGLTTQIASLKSLLVATLHHAPLFIRFSLTPPRGILLYGPPGTGKTLLLRAIANFLPATPIHLSGSVIGKYMGESEAAIRKVFKEARDNQPSIIFIDEVDSLAPRREGSEAGEGRVVATLLTEMDALSSDAEAKVIVIAATNRVGIIDPALRRPGRFEREVEIGIPDVEARREILELMLKKVPHSFDSSYISAIASRTHGFVGADLEALVRGAVMKVMASLESQLASLSLSSNSGDNTSLTAPPSPSTIDLTNVSVTERHIEETLKLIRPTAMREIFLETPSVRWADIGGQEIVKQRLRETVEWPLTHPQVFARLGAVPRKGLLLYGPPGCSKTLTAKALATEAGLNFLAVKGPELFSMYVGESERAVREIFRKARAAAPSIIFFDEIDALSGTRHGGGSGGVNVLTALLNEMDGIEVLKNVTVLAATNRPDMIDPALLRPGRLDTHLYIGPPDASAREQIFRIQAQKIRMLLSVDIPSLAANTEGFSGAEIVNICNEAVLLCLRRSWKEEEKRFEEKDGVSMDELNEAIAGARKGITREMVEFYEEWEAGQK